MTTHDELRATLGYALVAFGLAFWASRIWFGV